MKKLAVISTHPIQYNAPLFRFMAANASFDLKVFYTLGNSDMQVQDKGFGRRIEWDIPLLEGYSYEFLKNTANNAGTSHFRGVDNPGILEAIKDYAPDALFVFGWSFVSHLKVLRHFKGKIPILFRGDSTLLDETKSLKTLLRRIMLSWVYKHIDYALYVGQNNRQYFLAHGVKEENLVYAPHAIDNSRFREGPENRVKAKALRQELNISPDEIIALFAGKLEAKKNPQLLLDAFISLKLANTHLVFVGNGNQEEDLKAQAREKGGNIHFLPFQNQSAMPYIYLLGDLLVLPSQGPGETWGLCVNEAMAGGLPVIVSDKVGCAVDLVEDKVNGFIFKHNDLTDLANKLRRCFYPVNLLRQMGRKSREIIKNSDYAHVLAAIESIMVKQV